MPMDFSGVCPPKRWSTPRPTTWGASCERKSRGPGRPAAASEALSRITPDWQQRVWHAQLMGDDDVRPALAAGGGFPRGGRELMRRFGGRPAEPVEPTGPADVPAR